MIDQKHSNTGGDFVQRQEIDTSAAAGVRSHPAGHPAGNGSPEGGMGIGHGERRRREQHGTAHLNGKVASLQLEGQISLGRRMRDKSVEPWRLDELEEAWWLCVSAWVVDR